MNQVAICSCQFGAEFSLAKDEFRCVLLEYIQLLDLLSMVQSRFK